jgi:hypothetical protein
MLSAKIGMSAKSSRSVFFMNVTDEKRQSKYGSLSDELHPVTVVPFGA